MKKTAFTCLFSFFLLLLIIPAIAAEANQITVTVQQNNVQKEIIIEGQLAADSAQSVTIVIWDPKGGIVYLGQTNTDEDGAYQFNYKPQDWVAGEYAVRVGANGLDSPVTKKFTLNKQTSETGGTGSAGSELEAQKDTFIITSQQLLNSKDGKVIINVGNGITSVVLPGNTADLLGHNTLELHYNSMILTISPGMLQNVNGLELLSIEIGIQPLTEKERQQLLQNNEGSSLRFNGDSMMFQFELTYTLKDGKKYKPESFMPVEARILLNAASMNLDLTGLYQYNDNNKNWKYLNPFSKWFSNSKHELRVLLQPGLYAAAEHYKKYDDVPEEFWGYHAVTFLSGKYIITGKTAQTFAPEQSITRAEFSVLLSRLLQLEQSEENENNVEKGEPFPFTDVHGSDWFFESIKLASKAGLIKGRSPNAFKPNDMVSREEMAILMIRAQQFITGTKPEGTDESERIFNNYTDQNQVSAWAKPYVSTSIQLGLMKGRADHCFSPAGHATRAEAAQGLYNLFMLHAK